MAHTWVLVAFVASCNILEVLISETDLSGKGSADQLWLSNNEEPDPISKFSRLNAKAADRDRSTLWYKCA